MLLLITYGFGFGHGAENKLINFLIWINVFKESLNTAVHYKPLPYEYKVKLEREVRETLLEDLEEFPEVGHEASKFYTNMCQFVRRIVATRRCLHLKWCRKKYDLQRES